MSSHPAPVRPSTRPSERRGFATFGMVADLASVSVFIALGRRTHAETGLAGYLDAARPFITALVVAWAIMMFWYAMRRGQPDSRTHASSALRGNRAISGLWPAGVLVWVITAGGGLAVRASMGGGVTGGFPYVTFAVLGAFMLGWRVIAHFARR